MGDLGDLFDMFSQDGDQGKKQRNAQEPESSEKSSATDLKTRIISKIKQNKIILITTLGVVFLVVGIAGYFLFNYVNDHGIKGILDIVMPFIK
jgi:hypothetical protein